MGTLPFSWAAAFVFAFLTVVWNTGALYDKFIKFIYFLLTVYGAGLLWDSLRFVG